MKFNHKKFFNGVRLFLESQGRGLTQPRVNGLEFMLSAFEKDPHWADVRNISYAFATSCIETDWTFEPIQEYGSYARFEKLYGYKTKKGKELGNDAEGEGAKFSGKGYEQLTGESNYEKAENELRRQYPQLIASFETRTGQHFDLTDFPNQAKDREIAFAIMTLGMHQGWFTGKKLSDYITAQKTDYKGARRIINGQDRAAEIAGFAREFEKILKSSIEATPLSENSYSDDSPTVSQSDGATPPTEISETSDTALSSDSSAAATETTATQSTVEQTPTGTTETTVQQTSFQSETKELPAPAKEGSTKTAVATTAAGWSLAALPMLIWGLIQSAYQQGQIDLKAVFDLVIKFYMENTRYIFYSIFAVIGFLALKKIFKQLSFIVQMIINAIPWLHDIKIVPDKEK